jgi:hypothetical protein
MNKINKNKVLRRWVGGSKQKTKLAQETCAILEKHAESR